MKSDRALPRCKLVCINLKRRPDRKARFLNLVKNHGLKDMFADVQITAAVDGLCVTPATPGIHLLQPPTLTPNAQSKVNAGLFRTGVVGCALSHFGVWKQLVHDDGADWYVVCEDDAVFVNGSEGPNMLRSSLQQAITGLVDCGLLYIAGPPHKAEQLFAVGARLDDKPFTVPTMVGVHMNYTSMGTVCYAIHKCTAALLCTLAECAGMDDAVDWFLIRRWEALRARGQQVLACWPYLMYNADTSDSSIQSEFEQVPLLVAAWHAGSACGDENASQAARV